MLFILCPKDNAYEEINPGGYECGSEAVKLQTLLHCGQFYEVFFGKVQKLERCTANTEVMVKRNRGKCCCCLTTRHAPF